jgi:hypothetical protein
LRFGLPTKFNRAPGKNDTMTDQDSPGFPVVDKRRAAQDPPQTGADSAEAAGASDSPATPEPETPATKQDTPQTERSSATESHASSAQNATETDDFEPEAGEQERGGFPDPALLLSMAALQMDTSTLMTALLAIFDGQAWRSMGLIADPRTGEVQKDLPSAQLAIDCVQFLLSKVEGLLTDSERRDAQRRLSDLRMNYLVKLRES